MTKRLVGMISAALVLFSALNLTFPNNPSVSHAERENYSVYLPLVIGNGQSANAPSTNPTPTPIPSPTPTPEATFPTLDEFIASIASGQSSAWRGLYQPKNSPLGSYNNPQTIIATSHPKTRC
ncbi:MAG: hypothetical protein DDG59_04350 [Anaerolineae bacterium]|nr:MAG: hypothetical protein DDG59_04350 [Anaerolineae bacterium]